MNGIDSDPVRRHYHALGARHGEARRRPGFLHWLANRDRAAICRLLDVRAGLDALDAGCGAGDHARLMTTLGLRVMAIDYSPSMVEAVAPDVHEARVADLAELALGRRFDRVVCWGALEFVGNPARCFERLTEHTAPGGILIVQVPRPSIGGALYRWGHRLRSHIRVRLLDTDWLDWMATSRGLALTARERTFIHNEVLVWRRPLSDEE